VAEVINNRSRSLAFFMDPEQKFCQRTGKGSGFIFNRVNAGMVSVVYPSFQQESNRSWSSTYLPKEEQDPEKVSNFLE